MMVPGPLEVELAVAADFLADHGFTAAADVVRVLYPRLPWSVLAMRRLFVALALPGADLSGWELEAFFDGHPSARLPLRSVGRKVLEDRGDYRTLGLTLRGPPLSVTSGERYFTALGVTSGGETVVRRNLGRGPVRLYPGDSVTLRYDVSMQTFQLPPEVVAVFVPGRGRGTPSVPPPLTDPRPRG